MAKTALQIVNTFYPEVRSVLDATDPLLIEVTKRDCESRAVKNHTECALALACKRSYRVNGVIIALSVAYLVDGPKAYRYQVGPSISREVTAFDRLGTFEPGEYQLQVPVHKIGDPSRSGSRKYKKGNGKKKHYRHITTGVRTLFQTA